MSREHYLMRFWGQGLMIPLYIIDVYVGYLQEAQYRANETVRGGNIVCSSWESFH